MMSGKPFVTLPHSGNANSAKLETALFGAAQFQKNKKSENKLFFLNANHVGAQDRPNLGFLLHTGDFLCTKKKSKDNFGSL